MNLNLSLQCPHALHFRRHHLHLLVFNRRSQQRRSKEDSPAMAAAAAADAEERLLKVHVRGARGGGPWAWGPQSQEKGRHVDPMPIAVPCLDYYHLMISIQLVGLARFQCKIM